MRKIVVVLVATGVLVSAAAPAASAAGMPDQVQERICGKFNEKPAQSKGILRVEQTLNCNGGLPT